MQARRTVSNIFTNIEYLTEMSLIVITVNLRQKCSVV